MSRLPRALMAVVLLAIAPLTACGSDHPAEESFDNLPDCVADHASLGEPESIAHCLVDFPELHPDFADLAECMTWVTENGGYEDSSEAACNDYFVEIGA